MPIIDLPLEQLQAYKGINECPDDLDAYWDEAIAEMEALGNGYELTPAAFQVPGAECYELWYEGVGHARIHGHFVRPANRNGVVPAVLEFHGYACNAGDYAHLLKWACAGYCAAAIDCRGQGGSSEDRGTPLGNTQHGDIIRGLEDPDKKKLYYRSVFLDTAQLARIVMHMPEVDERRVSAYGSSQGGGLTLACAALTPTLYRAAPFMPFLSDYRRVWEMDLAVDAYAELREFFRFRDPKHEREAAWFTKLGYIDVHNMAHRIACKVRMYTGLMDAICPPSTQFAAYNSIVSEKEMVIYPDYAHENYPEAEDDLMQFFLKP